MCFSHSSTATVISRRARFEPTSGGIPATETDIISAHIDRRRHVLLVAGKPRRLTPRFWRLFTFLYRHRGDVIENDRLYAELYGDMEQPMAANAVRENVRRLRKALAGSRYEIVNHPTLGHELIVTAQRRTRRAAEASEGPSSVDANASTRS
jgi:DNA-binding response OmpR family regulator